MESKVYSQQAAGQPHVRKVDEDSYRCIGAMHAPACQGEQMLILVSLNVIKLAKSRPLRMHSLFPSSIIRTANTQRKNV